MSTHANEYDSEPEPAGYEPHGDRPLRSRHLLTLMRVFVVLGLAGLVLPGILITAGTAQRTAINACAAVTAYYAPTATFQTRFELFSPAGIGWNCYAVAFGGDEVLLASLGLIPGSPRLPRAPMLDS